MADTKKPSDKQRAKLDKSRIRTAHDSTVCARCKIALQPPGWEAELARLAHRYRLADLLADLGQMAPSEAHGVYLWLTRREVQI